MAGRAAIVIYALRVNRYKPDNNTDLGSVHCVHSSDAVHMELTLVHLFLARAGTTALLITMITVTRGRLLDDASSFSMFTQGNSTIDQLDYSVTYVLLSNQ